MARSFPPLPCTPDQPCPLRAWVSSARGPWAGVALAGLVATLATFAHHLPGLGWASPLILAVVLGVLLNGTLRQPLASLPAFAPGVGFVLRRLLRIGVALLGLQITLTQLAALGWQAGAVIIATVGGTFLFTLWCGKRLGVAPRLVRLIAAGTSICGASAVVAANAAVEGDDADVAYAVAMVTLFGTLSMLGFPLLGHLLNLSDHAFGLWSGVAIHEVAQVIAAAYQYSPAAGETATIAKLSRVLLVVPIVFILLATLPRRPTTEANAPTARSVTIPWFAVGFLALVGVASCDILPAVWLAHIAELDRALLTIALAGMGLATAPGAILRRGGRPMILAAVATAFISLFSLAGVWLVG